MKVLIGCEHSGIVREAFRARGHDAWSCDILPSPSSWPENGGDGKHFQCDLLQILDSPISPEDGQPFDLLIAHPPCDYLTVSGNRWFSNTAKASSPGILTGQARRDAQQEALAFVRKLWAASVPRIAIENPIGRLSTLWMKPKGKNGQTIQPWQFWYGPTGTGEVKATCLWLKGLPKLTPTTPNETGRHPACWLLPPGPDRKTKRSITYPGIANAMAIQWSQPLTA